MGHEGHGIRIKKGGTFVAEVVSVGLPGGSVNVIDMSTQDTEGYRELVAAAIAEPGSADFTVRFNPDLVDVPILGGTPQEIEFIFLLAGDETISIYGMFTDYTPGQFVSGEAMEATVTLQRTGWTPSATTPGSGAGINPMTGAVPT